MKIFYFIKYMIFLNILKNQKCIFAFCFFLVLTAIFISSCSSKREDIVILIPENASFQERLAAKEIRRYLYVRTNVLLSVSEITEEQLRGCAISPKN